jgi:hypothetical protein
VTVEIAQKDLAWWRSKIVRGPQNHRHGGPRGFGPIAARHAVHVLEQLVATSPSYSLAAPTLSEFSNQVGLTSKFAPRAVAMLARSGLVRAQLVPSPSITLLVERLPRRKNSAQSTPRRRLSRAEREQVFRCDRFRCGHCTQRFPPRISKSATSCLSACLAPTVKRTGSPCAESTINRPGIVSTRGS